MDISKLVTSSMGKKIFLPFLISIALYLALDINELFLFTFPIAPVIYGKRTRDTVGSVIIGMVPVISLFLDIHLANLHSLEPERFKVVISYFGKLSIIGGLQGLFAAKLQEQYFYVILIIGSFIWFLLFMTGID